MEKALIDTTVHEFKELLTGTVWNKKIEVADIVIDGQRVTVAEDLTTREFLESCQQEPERIGSALDRWATGEPIQVQIVHANGDRLTQNITDVLETSLEIQYEVKAQQERAEHIIDIFAEHGFPVEYDGGIFRCDHATLNYNAIQGEFSVQVLRNELGANSARLLEYKLRKTCDALEEIEKHYPGLVRNDTEF